MLASGRSATLVHVLEHRRRQLAVLSCPPPESQSTAATCMHSGGSWHRRAPCAQFASRCQFEGVHDQVRRAAGRCLDADVPHPLQPSPQALQETIIVRSCRRPALYGYKPYRQAILKCRQVHCAWANVESKLTISTGSADSTARCDCKQPRLVGGTFQCSAAGQDSASVVHQRIALPATEVAHQLCSTTGGLTDYACQWGCITSVSRRGAPTIGSTACRHAGCILHSHMPPVWAPPTSPLPCMSRMGGRLHNL